MGHVFVHQVEQRVDCEKVMIKATTGKGDKAAKGSHESRQEVPLPSEKCLKVMEWRNSLMRVTAGRCSGNIGALSYHHLLNILQITNSPK